MAARLSIELPSQPFDVAFHPQEPLMFSGHISGSVELTKIAEDDMEEGKTKTPSRDSTVPATERSPLAASCCWRKKGHSQACRAVAFMEAGQALLSGSSDRSLILRHTETGKRIWTHREAHHAAVNRLAAISDVTVASGDDNGEIKVWDVRQPACCAAMSVHDDFVADMHHVESKGKLLAVSGDGTLSVFDLRTNKKEARSEYAEDELLSVTVVKGGRKVVCGSQEGVLLLYSWGRFGDCSDRLPGLPQSVDSLIKLNEDAVVAGTQDGLLRVVSILPNRLQGVIGQHMDCPIERLALSSGLQLLASASHDNAVKLWDVTGAQDLGSRSCDDTDSGDDEDAGEEAEEQRVAMKRNASSILEGDTGERCGDGGHSGDGVQKKQKQMVARQSKESGKGKNKVKGGNIVRSNFFSDL